MEDLKDNENIMKFENAEYIKVKDGLSLILVKIGSFFVFQFLDIKKNKPG